MYAKLGDALIWKENSVKLLGLFIDSDLPFHGHIKVICKRAPQKISAIARLAYVIFEHKRETLIKTLFESHTRTHTRYCGCFAGNHFVGELIDFMKGH